MEFAMKVTPTTITFTSPTGEITTCPSIYCNTDYKQYHTDDGLSNNGFGIAQKYFYFGDKAVYEVDSPFWNEAEKKINAIIKNINDKLETFVGTRRQYKAYERKLIDIQNAYIRHFYDLEKEIERKIRQEYDNRKKNIRKEWLEKEYIKTKLKPGYKMYSKELDELVPEFDKKYSYFNFSKPY